MLIGKTFRTLEWIVSDYNSKCLHISLNGLTLFDAYNVGGIAQD